MKFNLYFLITTLVLFIPLFTFAAEVPFTALIGIPGITTIGGSDGLNQYINALYRLSISIAALLAVIKIVAAGAKYMLSDIITHKEEAKKDIQGALIGLLIVIGAVIILNTVNTDLTKLDLNIETATIKQGQDLLDAIEKSQRTAVDKTCAKADTTKGEACITESCYTGDCKADCELKNGVYFSGKEYGWVTDKIDYFDKCTFVKKLNIDESLSGVSQTECSLKGSDYVWEKYSSTGLPDSGGVDILYERFGCIYKPNLKIGDTLNITSAECSAKGANYRWSEGAQKCIITLPPAQLQKKLTEAGLCMSGYDCKTAPCEGTSVFAMFSHKLACNSICAENGNMSYNTDLDTCYSSTKQ